MHTYAEEQVRAPEDDVNKLEHDKKIYVYAYLHIHMYIYTRKIMYAYTNTDVEERDHAAEDDAKQLKDLCMHECILIYICIYNIFMYVYIHTHRRGRASSRCRGRCQQIQGPMYV